jgi:hypothetical protein
VTMLPANSPPSRAMELHVAHPGPAGRSYLLLGQASWLRSSTPKRSRFGRSRSFPAGHQNG